MGGPSIQDRYFVLLKAHVARPAEEHLAAAAELGRELVLAGIPPEEIAELHEAALGQLGQACPDMKLVDTTRLVCAPLMELLMAYGLAFHQQLEARRRAEEALRRTTNTLNSILASSTEYAVAATDLDFRIIHYNPAAERIFGYKADDVIGRTVQEVHSLENVAPERFDQAIEVIGQGGKWEHELEMEGADGERMFIHLVVMPMLGEAGECIGYILFARDVTREKELEAQLLQAQKLESLGTLVGGIAHDFNNMLTGILGFTQLLRHEVEPGSSLDEKLQRIEVLSERAADMIKQLLTFSRKEKSQKTSLLLHPFLKELGKLLRRMIPETIEVDLRLSPEDIMVKADPTQLQQVLMNLAVNARDAMPEGGLMSIETARVQLDEAFCQGHPDVQPGRFVRLSVSDTGVGIPAEIRSRIFDPFFTTKEVGKGTGLGLPVVYGIVKKHGGAIEVETEVGQGTRFQVYLPLAESGGVQEMSSTGDVNGGTETILLVEDEPVVLELGEAALEHFGYRVLTARNGEEALAVYQARQKEIALVILDVVMPKMGGLETTRALRQINPNVKVLLASGYGSAHKTAEELLEGGICGLVRKPYQVDELARAVRAALET